MFGVMDAERWQYVLLGESANWSSSDVAENRLIHIGLKWIQIILNHSAPVSHKTWFYDKEKSVNTVPGNNHGVLWNPRGKTKLYISDNYNCSQWVVNSSKLSPLVMKRRRSHDGQTAQSLCWINP